MRLVSRRPSVLATLTSFMVVTAVLLSVLGVTSAAAAQTPPGASWIRAVHLITGAGPMQVSIAPSAGGGGASTVLTASTRYGTATDYRAFAPGSYTVSVRPAGSPDVAPVLSSTFDAPAAGALSLTLLGSKGSPRLAVLKDDLTAPQAGQARVRVLPAADGANQVTLSAQGGPVIARDAVFGQPTSYASVPAGRWPLSAVAGSRSGSQTVVLDSGAVYTVLVAGGPTGQLTVRALQDAAGIASSEQDRAAPVGGVQTGGGGAADLVVASPGSEGSRTAPALGWAVGLVVGTTLAVRRRTARHR